jgi:hypothetical protein
MELLNQQQQEYRARATASLQDIARKIDGFHQACIDMSRLVAGLDVTRIMGKVECSRHTSVKDRLDELLGDLEGFQRTIGVALKEIDRMNQFILAETRGLLAAAQAAA